MKKIITFIAVLMLLFIGSGCDNDAFFTEEPEVSLKSAEMSTIPIKADMYAIVSEDREGVAYAGNLGGTITHLGNLIFEKKYFFKNQFRISGRALGLLGNVWRCNCKQWRLDALYSLG